MLGKLHLKNLEPSDVEPPNKKQKTTEGKNIHLMSVPEGNS